MGGRLEMGRTAGEWWSWSDIDVKRMQNSEGEVQRCGVGGAGGGGGIG